MAVLAWPAVAEAHDWFTGTHDPVTGYSCCGGSDCAVLRDEDVRAIKGGYIVVSLPRGFPGADTVSLPILIPNSRAQPGKDPAHYAMCIWSQTAQCFFTPWPAY